MGERLYPLTFEPVLRDYMWGGRRLERLFGRALPPGITAESWEVSAHPSSPTAVAHGPLRGLTLPEVVERLGADLLGANVAPSANGSGFPLLVKLLDAMEAWDETGQAPNVLVGTKANGSLTRPHCAWPTVARYRGTGDPNDTTSWQCVPRAES